MATKGWKVGRIGTANYVVPEPDGGYRVSCLFCRNMFRVPPREKCKWRNCTAHGSHRMCPDCYQIERLLAQDKVDIVIERYGRVPQALDEKVQLEREWREGRR